MNRTLLALLFCMAMMSGSTAARETRDEFLDRGIRNADVAAAQLMQEAGAHPEEAAALLQTASSYAPDLPAVYFDLSRATFSFTSTGILTSIDHVISGISAYSRNFWWSFSLAGGVFFGLVLSFVVSLLIVSAIRGFADLPLVVHEIGESRQKLLPLIVLAAISLVSPLFFIAGFLVLIGLYLSRIDRIIVYGSLVALLAAPLLFRAASSVVNVSSSGSMKAIVEVNEARGNDYALTALQTASEPQALFSYALALKRTGRYEPALAAYTRLLGSRPDARAYINMGNTYVGLNDLDQAFTSYQKALEAGPLAAAYYNLSAVSRERLDFEKGNEYYRKALEADRSAVSAYQADAARTPNRFVADAPLSFRDLWGLAETYRGRTSTFDLVALPGWTTSVVALALLAAFPLLVTRSRNRAYRCGRCNEIFCPRCEKHIMWGQMCHQCFQSLVKLDELETKERVARLLSIYEHQKKRRSIMKVLSFILPGTAQIFGGKVLYGLLLLWPFLFLVFLPLTNSLLSVGSLISHSVIDTLALLCAGIIYVLTNIYTRQRIAKGWL